MKNYWLPRFLLQQDVSSVNGVEKGYLNTALRYLQGRITLAADQLSSESDHSVDEEEVQDSKREFAENEYQNDENGKKITYRYHIISRREVKPTWVKFIG